MKAFLFACLALVGLSVGSYYALEELGMSTEAETSSPSVRLD
ncbi:MAG: hypothetical protein AAGG09_05855 [Pseudomonadota bacterium]